MDFKSHILKTLLNNREEAKWVSLKRECQSRAGAAKEKTLCLVPAGLAAFKK